MPFRVYDVVGVVAVIAWVAVVALYTYEIKFRPDASEAPVEGVIIAPGESWMLLTRDDVEVGVAHETRTPISDGWLLEYEFKLNISSFGASQMLSTSVKATVDDSAVLRKFGARIESALSSFDVQGRVEGDEIVLKFDLQGVEDERRITVGAPPRLSNSVFNQLAAEKDKLKPGATFEQEYFDPMVMGMTKMRFEFIREHELEVYGTKVKTFHFRQQLANNELDVYVDGAGDVQIQELPLRMVAARVPESLGRARYKAMKTPDKPEGKPTKVADISVDDAVSLIRGSGAVSARTLFVVSQIPEELRLILDSGAQHAVSTKSDEVVVDTSVAGSGGILTDEGREALLRSIPLPGGDELMEKLIFKEESESVGQKADHSARALQEMFKFSPAAVRDSLDEVLQTQSGDSAAMSRFFVGVLRAQGIPARYVLGADVGEERPRPHYWVQYWGGERFVDLDLTRATLLPATTQLQLSVASELDQGSFEAALPKLKIERRDRPDAPASDFN